MSPATILLLFSIFILPLQNYCTTASSSDLKQPKDDSLNPDEWKALSDFMNNIPHSEDFTWNFAEPACTWKGVTCGPPNNNTVTYLRLPGKSFVGKIPPNTIGKLTSLRVLSLRFNGLSGDLPSDISNLTSLTRLSLNNNNFTGVIPSGFSKFTKLIRLTLNHNNFSGSIPYIPSENLLKFDVSFNKLIGAIPRSLSKFHVANFSKNIYLCGDPTHFKCNESFPFPDPVKEENTRNRKPEIIVGVSVGSGVVLLILLCCVRKKVCQPSLKVPPEAVKNKVERNVNNLVLFDRGVYNFDLDDLLNASAEVLGEGSVGKSYKQVIEGKDTTVVVKRLIRDVVVTEGEFRLKMEGLGKMKNENLVPLIGYYYSKDEKWLVYDYMPAGSLHARLHGSIAYGQTQLDWKHRMKIAMCAARGLAYLHAYLHEDGNIVVHGNISSTNILIRQETNNEASVSDYGLNALFGDSGSQEHDVTGYWAPEVHNTRRVTCQSDVYSFGLLLLELLTGKTPKALLELLTGKTPKKASLGEEGAHFSKLLESCEQSRDDIFDVKLRMNPYNVERMRQMFQIAKNCVSSEPKDRPTMQVVVSELDNVWDDDHSKGYDNTPSTETHDTPSTITLDTPSTFTP